MSQRASVWRDRAAIAAAVVLPVIPLAAGFVVPGNSNLEHLLVRGAVTLAGLVSTLACWSASRRTFGRVRRGWMALAGSAASWSASNIIAAYAELTQDRTLPVPSPADVPSGLALLLAALGILSFLESALSPAARMRTLLDGLLIGSAVVFVGWAFVLEDAYRAAGEGVGRVLSLAYPVGDLVLVAIVFVSLARVQSRRAWVLLATGLGMLTVGHAAFAYLEVAKAYEPGAIETMSWVVGVSLIGLAALSTDVGMGEAVDEVRAGRLRDILIPLIPVGLAVLVAGQRLLQGALDPFLIGNAGVLAVLLVARQILAQLEYLDLNKQLEKRVEDRTAELARQEQQFRALVQNASDVVTVVDRDMRIRYQSASCERILGYRFGELADSDFAELLHPQAKDDALAVLRQAPAPPSPPSALELLLRRKDGRWTLTETTVSNLMHQPNVQGLLVTSRDIGQRKALEEQLRQQALTDPLTGLANRILFTDRLRHAVQRASRNPETLAVLLVDLDGFKQVNDSLGHSAGDQLLIEVAARLLDSVRQGDTVARMGGDEFAVLLERATEEGPTVVAQRALYRLRAPVVIEGKPLVVQGSIGVATGSTSSFSAEDLLRNADLAMYEAKARGKGAFEVYAPEMHAAAIRRVELETDLRRAIREGELLLHYQPIIELPSGNISGAEALVRWAHPERGLVPPNEFIGIAEESDLILSLGRWVLRTACIEAKRLHDTHPRTPQLTMAVNLAARQLMSPYIVKEVREALEESQVDPRTIVLEITEGALMSDPGPILGALMALKDLGVRLAIDDFGTGWSSLSRLRSFPVDKLKIDRSFISEVRSADDEAPIVAAIVAMAHSLHLTTVAEGVETLDQLACLYGHGCEEVQGYVVSKPVPSADFERLLVEHEALVENMPTHQLSRAEHDYAAIVAEAAQANVGTTVHPLLAQIQRVSGADGVFVTHLDFERGVHRVTAARTGGGIELAEGSSLSFEGWAEHAIETGGALEGDVRAEHPNDPLARVVGARNVACVPVRAPDGAVYGGLFAVSAEPGRLAGDVTQLLDLFSRLIGEHVTTTSNL